MKNASLLILVSLLSLQCNHVRDNSKTLADTLEWLRGNVQAYGGWFIGPDGKPTPGWEVFFKKPGSNPCVLSFLQRWTVSDGKPRALYRIVSSDVALDLAALDPTGTRVTKHERGIYFVRLETTKARPTIKITQYVHEQVKRALSQEQITAEVISFPKRIGVIFSDGWAVAELRSKASFDEPAWTFGFEDEGRSHRVVSAFKQVIQICGGKSDPF